MKKIDSVIWGVSFVLFGFVLCFSIFGILNTDSFVNGWPLFFIIVPCFFGVAFGKYMLGSLIGLILSVFALFLVNGLINFLLILELIFPLIIILIGFYMIKKGK